eukprot:1170542-Pyramimonas_sp.AAC.1
MPPNKLSEVGPAVCNTPEAEIAEKYPESEDDHRRCVCSRGRSVNANRTVGSSELIADTVTPGD